MTLRRYLRIAPEESFRELPEAPEWFNFNQSEEGLETPDEQYGTFEGAATRGPLYAAPEDYVSDGDTAVPVDIENVACLLYAALGSIESGYVTELIDWEEREDNNETIDEGEVMIGTDDNYYICTGHHNAHDDHRPVTGDEWELYWEEYEPTYDHVFKPAESLPSMRLAVGKDSFEHRFKGMVVDSLTLEYEDGFLVAGIDWIGAEDEKHELAEIETSDLPEDVVTSLMGTFHRDDEDFTGSVEEFELNLENNVEVEEHTPASQRFPVAAVPEELEITVELTVSFEDSEELEAYWGDEEGPNELVEETDFSIAFEDSNEDKLEIVLPRVICQDHSANVSGRDRIEQTMEYEALVDHELGYPLVATLISDIQEYSMS